jgi:hypothetical protein
LLPALKIGFISLSAYFGMQQPARFTPLVVMHSLLAMQRFISTTNCAQESSSYWLSSRRLSCGAENFMKNIRAVKVLDK